MHESMQQQQGHQQPPSGQLITFTEQQRVRFSALGRILHMLRVSEMALKHTGVLEASTQRLVLAASAACSSCSKRRASAHTASAAYQHMQPAPRISTCCQHRASAHAASTAHQHMQPAPRISTCSQHRASAHAASTAHQHMQPAPRISTCSQRRTSAHAASAAHQHMQPASCITTCRLLLADRAAGQTALECATRRQTCTSAHDMAVYLCVCPCVCGTEASKY